MQLAFTGPRTLLGEPRMYRRCATASGAASTAAAAAATACTASGRATRAAGRATTGTCAGAGGDQGDGSMGPWRAPGPQQAGAQRRCTATGVTHWRPHRPEGLLLAANAACEGRRPLHCHRCEGHCVHSRLSPPAPHKLQQATRTGTASGWAAVGGQEERAAGHATPAWGYLPARRGSSGAIARNSATSEQCCSRPARLQGQPSLPSTGPHTTAASGHSDPPAGKQAMQACQQRAALATPQQQQVQQRRPAAAAVAGAARLAAPSSSSRSSRAATRWGTSYMWRGPAVQGCARAACSCGAVRSGAPAATCDRRLHPPASPASRLPPVCARRERDPILAPVIQMGPGGEVRLERGRGAVAAAGLAAQTACCLACCCFHAVLYAHAKKNDPGDCGPLRLPDAQPHHLPQPAHQRPGGHAGERKQQAVLLCSPLV